MKRSILIIGLIGTLGLSLNSCKKKIYGCTDSTASNYSSQANFDDGSCFFDGQDANVLTYYATVTNWIWADPSYYATINVAGITQEVCQYGAVLVYIQTQTDTYSQLPVTFYPSTSWSTSVEVVHAPGNVKIFWTDSDHLTLDPGSWTFKIVIIKNKGQVKPDQEYYNEIANKK